VVAALFAFGSCVLVHRCVDVPARAALRRLPDRIMVFAASERVARMRLIPLTSAGVAERDR
jgi:peptidoglycan/LPS O-acetylase OafA/YrhL